jgi:hypothetical protein
MHALSTALSIQCPVGLVDFSGVVMNIGITVEALRVARLRNDALR